MNTMEQQYFETALWSSSDSENGDSLDSEGYTIDDFADGERERAAEELHTFAREVAPPLDREGIEGDDAQLAHDFWLTRNGHGVGFWDRPHLWGGQETADALTAATKAYGERDIYKGDDGKLYFFP